MVAAIRGLAVIVGIYGLVRIGEPVAAAILTAACFLAVLSGLVRSEEQHQEIVRLLETRASSPN